MRVYITADMEGVSGVVHTAQTEPGAREYEYACALMVGEVNAAVEGAFAGGAIYVLVNDSHWNMRNIRLTDLDPRAELISGSPKPFSMMQGISSSFDLVFCVGYHARAGTEAATIDHTYTSRVQRVTVNGLEVGELGLNALLAGEYDVPVLLVTGDQQLAAEAHALLGEYVTTVQVKEALGRGAARCLPIAEARDRIYQGALYAVERRRTMLDGQGLVHTAPPFTLEAEFAQTGQAEMALLCPGSHRTGPRSISFTHSDYREVFRAWRAMYNLAGSD